MSKSRKNAYLALLGNVIIWSAALPIVKPTLAYITPFQFLFLRYLIATAILLPLFSYLFISQKITFRSLATIIPTEILFLVYAAIVYVGLNYTTALQASFILNTRPIFITFMGIFLLKEKEELHEWIGLCLSVIGTFFLIGYPLITGQTSLTDSTSIGNLIILIGVVISTAYAYAVKKNYHSTPKLHIQSTNAILGVISFSLLLYFTHDFPTANDLNQPSVAFASLYMGLLGTPIALGLLNYGFSLIEASEATLFTYLEPLIYIPLAVIWLNESIHLYQLASLAIILTGVIIAGMRPKTKLHHSPTRPRH